MVNQDLQCGASVVVAILGVVATFAARVSSEASRNAIAESLVREMKKVRVFAKEKISYDDYKDTYLLRKFSSGHGKEYYFRKLLGSRAYRATTGLFVVSPAAARRDLS